MVFRADELLHVSDKDGRKEKKTHPVQGAFDSFVDTFVRLSRPGLETKPGPDLIDAVGSGKGEKLHALNLQH